MISQLLSKSKRKEHSQRSRVVLIHNLVLLLLTEENYLTILSYITASVNMGGERLSQIIIVRTKAELFKHLT